MNNYSNNNPYYPHGFKVEVKIKYDAIKAIAGNFPTRTVVMMALLKQNLPALTWVNYCAMVPVDQFI